MGVDKPDQASQRATRPPRADQLVVQLTQGLQSKDGKLLTVSHPLGVKMISALPLCCSWWQNLVHCVFGCTCCWCSFYLSIRSSEIGGGTIIRCCSVFHQISIAPKVQDKNTGKSHRWCSVHLVTNQPVDTAFFVFTSDTCEVWCANHTYLAFMFCLICWLWGVGVGEFHFH